MMKFNDRCLAVIVVYDPLRADAAVARLRALIEKSFRYYSLRIVTNNPLVDGDIMGSNRCGEFSGWTEGVSSGDYENYDVIIFANDTFGTTRPFSTDNEKAFLEKILTATSRRRPFLVGELAWHINYQLIFKRKQFLLKWVRTNFFAISSCAANRIGGISLEYRDVSLMVNADTNGNFILSRDIPEVVRWRIENWLNPSTYRLGWHGAEKASKDIKRLKAMCVLQELDMSRRCIEAGVTVYSSNKMKKKDYLFSLIHQIQCWLF